MFQSKHPCVLSKTPLRFYPDKMAAEFPRFSKNRPRSSFGGAALDFFLLIPFLFASRQKEKYATTCNIPNRTDRRSPRKNRANDCQTCGCRSVSYGETDHPSGQFRRRRKAIWKFLTGGCRKYESQRTVDEPLPSEKPAVHGSMWHATHRTTHEQRTKMVHHDLPRP